MVQQIDFSEGSWNNPTLLVQASTADLENEREQKMVKNNSENFEEENTFIAITTSW